MKMADSDLNPSDGRSVGEEAAERSTYCWKARPKLLAKLCEPGIEPNRSGGSTVDIFTRPFLQTAADSLGDRSKSANKFPIGESVRQQGARDAPSVARDEGA